MATVPKFRIDVDIHNLLMHSSPAPVKIPEPKGLTLPEPVFPQFPDKLSDPGPEILPEKRDWRLSQIYRSMRGWLFPYIRSRVLPGDFHPITAYLFVEYKCNLDCWYCWAYNNQVKGMTEDIARRSIDWLYDHGLSLPRIQMQPGLLVLLGLQQQSQRYDRRRCPPLD